MSTPPLEDWQILVERFTRTTIEAGLALSTAQRRARRLAVLPTDLSIHPLDATGEQVRDYFDRLRSSTAPPASTKAQRLVVRAFYRWAQRTGLRGDDPAPVEEHRIPVTEVWEHVLDQFAVDQRAQQLGDSTIAQRQKYVRRFASSTTLTPFAVTHADVHGWLEQLHVADETRKAHRAALRAFYRWAYRTRQIHDDPMELSVGGPTALPVPAPWDLPIRRYRSHLRAGGIAETSIGTYMETLRTFARQNAHLDPWAVTIDDVGEWMGEKRWARETRRRYRQTLLGFYAWAHRSGHVLTNPVEGVPKVRTRGAHGRPAEDDDYLAALSAARGWEWIALRLAAELGLRRGEVARIHSRDLTGRRGEWVLDVHGKGDKRRLVPVPDELAVQLRVLPAGYAFPGGDGGHLSPRWLGRCGTALLPTGVTMHQLRHRFATRAYHATHDLLGVQTLLGHASPATTQGYIGVRDQQLRAIVAAAGTHR